MYIRTYIRNLALERHARTPSRARKLQSKIFNRAIQRKGMANYDIVGSIAIVKFPRDAKRSDKLRFAREFLSKHKHIKTVLEKSDKFKGRLRTQKTRYLAGVRTTETIHKENGCVFYVDVEKCYFSPRLSEERKEIAGKVKPGERVLVMFGGVAPYAIVIAKLSKAKEVVSVELGRACTKYAKLNVEKNKLQDRVEVLQGDVKRVVPKLKGKFDRIVMPRPKLKESFLEQALAKIKRLGSIHFYGFAGEEEKRKLVEEIKKECARHGKKIKVSRVKKAGDIGKKFYRWRVDFRVLN
ncbi:class I SAM-dependent methyltransferase family protein [Candidatus Pacearchaeota archaeon]|nr:MAG: class I SAM-dependent methyltransferase family protein [Candidatus Pacearchaeota archaeon]